jgi:hypothetical protein
MEEGEERMTTTEIVLTVAMVTLWAEFVCLSIGVVWFRRKILEPYLDETTAQILHNKDLALSASGEAARALRVANRAEGQVKSVMALDVGYKGEGWLVLITKVNGTDRVCLKRIKPDMSLREYKFLVDQLRQDYGGVLTHVDQIRGAVPRHFWDT